MALKTFQVDVLSVYHFISNGPVRVVAVRTADFPISDRMSRLSQQLGLYLLMTGGALRDLDLLFLFLGIFRVNSVAPCT